MKGGGGRDVQLCFNKMRKKLGGRACRPAEGRSIVGNFLKLH